MLRLQVGVSDANHVFVHWSCHGTNLHPTMDNAGRPHKPTFHESHISGIDFITFNEDRSKLQEVVIYRCACISRVLCRHAESLALHFCCWRCSRKWWACLGCSCSLLEACLQLGLMQQVLPASQQIRHTHSMVTPLTDTQGRELQCWGLGVQSSDVGCLERPIHTRLCIVVYCVVSKNVCVLLVYCPVLLCLCRQPTLEEREFLEEEALEQDRLAIRLERLHFDGRS